MQAGPVTIRDFDSTCTNILQDPKLRRLLGYWRGLRRGRLMPARADIDATDIPWALDSIYLIDFEAATKEFRYRLAGDEICRTFDRSTLKGLELADFLSPEQAEYVRDRWLRMIHPPSILAMRGLVYFVMDRITQGTRLMMPLSDSGDDQVTGVFGMTLSDHLDGPAPRRPGFAEINYVPVTEIP